MSQTLSLYRLQQIDSQFDRTQARLQAIGKTLENDEELRLANKNAHDAEDRRRTTNQALKQAELDVQNQRIKIEQVESSLYSGASHSPKELQDLQNDVAALKRHLARLEDQQLEAMVSLEQVESSQQTAQAELARVQARWSEQNQSLQQEQVTLQNEVNRLSTERAATAGSIPTPELTLYEQLRQQRRGVAVAAIRDNSCSACGSFLSAAQVQSARSTSQMLLCPSCGRILYGS